MAVWFMMGTENKLFLVNLDVFFGVTRDEKTGNAIAVSVSGATVDTGQQFEVVVDDLTRDDEPAPGK